MRTGSRPVGRTVGHGETAVGVNVTLDGRGKAFKAGESRLIGLAVEQSIFTEPLRLCGRVKG